MPTLSIITVTYNAKDYLDKTIQSVLFQNYKDLEHVIVDGGSSDGSKELLSHYNDDFHRVLIEPDKGIYDAMNKGLRMAKGEFVYFLNAGDVFITNDILENIFKGDQLCDIIYGDAVMVSERGEVLGSRRLRPPKQLKWDSFKMGMLVCHQAILVRKSIAPEYNLSYKISADYDWVIRCILNSKTIFNYNAPIAYFALGGKSKEHRIIGLKERFSISKKYYGFFTSVLYLIFITIRFIIQVPKVKRLN